MPQNYNTSIRGEKGSRAQKAPPGRLLIILEKADIICDIFRKAALQRAASVL
jgi:hypothetical protein